jgi:hypothetical protein
MTAEAQTEYEIPAEAPGAEPGTYLAILTALKPFTLYETSDGWTREKPDAGIVEAYNKIDWIFHTDDGEQLEGMTSTARSERSTLFAWATGLGMPAAVVLDRSKPIPASQLIGREGMVTVSLDKNGRSRVTSVVPAPKAKAAPAPIQPGEFDGAPRQQPVAEPKDELPF